MSITVGDLYRTSPPETPVAEELDVDGALPAGLRGTLYRNGPVRFEAGGFVARHPFDGDGMVSQYVLDEGRVRFRSRYVRTPKYRQEEAGKGARIKGIGNTVPGWWRNLKLPADAANTHAVMHADRLLALSDAGKPWELDPDTLATVGVCTLDGSLSNFGRFSPHPRIDPVTGEMFNFGLDFVPGLLPRLPVGLKCFRTGPDGRTTVLATVPLTALHVQHDFSITERFLVFLISPLTVDPVAALQVPQEQAARWHSDRPTRVVLVPRDGGAPIEQVLDEDLMYIHITNAFEDERGDVHVDVVRYADPDDFFLPAREFRTTTENIGGCSARVTITPAGVTVRDLNEHRLELPQHDQRRTGRPYSYGYYATLDAAPDATNGVYKIDHDTGAEQHFAYDPGHAVGEPLFVPAVDGAAEDDGWLLTLVTDVDASRTGLHVFDARHVDAGPIARATGPTGFFPGFHGSFTDRVARA